MTRVSSPMWTGPGIWAWLFEARAGGDKTALVEYALIIRITLAGLNVGHTFFYGGETGDWAVTAVYAIAAEALPTVPRLAIGPSTDEAVWSLRGVASHVRYANRAELDDLATRRPDLGRPQATWAALIPIRKSAKWWALAQDERRAVFEEQSRHNGIGRTYLPRIARALYHGRDLGEPFDFLTWFEFAPEDANAFDDLVGALRSTAEWQYVEREVDIRLER